MTTTLIFLFGLFTVLLSLTVAIKFRNQSLNAVAEDSARLSSALAWQLVGEAVLGLGTLAFATAAHFEVLHNWSTELQSAVRGVMFTVAGATTLHLYLTINRLR